jgi:acetoin utilization deacetylase AcuC-like enzyme
MFVLGALGDLDQHDMGEWHPEAPIRLKAVAAGVADAGVADGATIVEPRQATSGELQRVHPRLYCESLERLTKVGGELDPDTVVTPGSWPTALYAAGTGLAAIEALERGAGDVAFVAVRPPGHHARAAQGMGFCLFNNVAVAAAALAERGERVVIVDWDVHHGNGTQEIFWDDPRVFYISTHQAPLYPGTGRISETGGPGAPGLTLNFPFPEGTTGDVLLRALDEVAAPLVEAFDPTWVLISAGFDAHRDDPLAGMRLSAGDYTHLAKRVAQFAPGRGRLAVFLEGGYDLRALRNSVASTLTALAGGDAGIEPATSGGPGAVTVEAAKRIQEQLRERDV